MDKLRPLAPFALFFLLALVPLLAGLAGDAYAITFMTRVLIFALAALGLNLILGFGGMTSLGHAAFMGVGAYVIGIMVQAGVTNGLLHLAALLLIGGALAAVIGALSLRASGLAFIMLTLAFAQLLYFIGTGLKSYGGDDGFSFRGRSQFGALFSLADDRTLYYAVLVCLGATAWLVQRMVHSRFGMALRGSRSNLRRVESIGLPAYRYQLTAFVISGMICTLAGGLLANLAQFASPAYMHWSRSADLLIMAMVGGMASVLGPVVGAAALLLLEEGLASLTPHWQAPLGIILVLIVLFARNGLSELVEIVSGAARRLFGGRLPDAAAAGVAAAPEARLP
jgi:branched-chain amino acid transport system permease protein